MVFVMGLLAGVIGLAAFQSLAGPRQSEAFFRAVESVRLRLPWSGAAKVGLSLLLVFASAFILSEEPEAFPVLLTVLVVLGFLLFVRAWGREFLFLMSLGEDQFTGRFDKVIWAASLIVLPPVGLWTFRVYREVRWPEAVAKPEGVSDLH